MSALLPVALILAGGRSLRLGQDKAALNLAGQSLLARTARLAQAVCSEVYISGRDPGGLGLNLPWFADENPGFGPLGGILTALNLLQRPCLALSCDLPLLDEETLRTLIAAWRLKPQEAVMTTFRQIETGYIESLVAIYEPEAAPKLKLAMEEGFPKLSRAIVPGLRHNIDYSPADTQAFFNLNRPGDLAVLRDQMRLDIG